MKQNKNVIITALSIFAIHQSIQGAMVSGARQFGQGLMRPAAQTSIKSVPTTLTGINIDENAISTPTFTPAPMTIPNYTMPSYAVPQRFNNPAGQIRSFSTQQPLQQNFVIPTNFILMPSKEESIIFLKTLFDNKSLYASIDEITSFINRYFTIFTYQDLINIFSEAEKKFNSMSPKYKMFYSFLDMFKNAYFNEHQKQKESTTDEERYNLLTQTLKVKPTDLEKIIQITEKYSKDYFYQIILQAQALQKKNGQNITLVTMLDIIKHDQLKKKTSIIGSNISEKTKKIIDLLQSGLPKKNDVNIPLVAQLIMNDDNDNSDWINSLINQAKSIAGDQLINTNHFREALATIQIGPKSEKLNPLQTDFKFLTSHDNGITIHYPQGKLHSNAVHEASHAIAEIKSHNPTFVTTLSIDPRANFLGNMLNAQLYHTSLQDQLNLSYIITCLAGAVGEQIFDTYRYQDYSHEMLTNSDDIFNFLNSRIGADSDMKLAIMTAKKILSSQNLAQNKQNQFVKEIIADCYKKTYQLISANKENVQKLVNAAMKKGTLHEDEIYDILNIAKPLFYFEQGPLPEAEMAKAEKYRFPESSSSPKLDDYGYNASGIYVGPEHGNYDAQGNLFEID